MFSGFVQLVDSGEGDIPFTIGKPCAPAPPMTRTTFWLVFFFIRFFLRVQLILEIIPKSKKTCGSLIFYIIK